MFYNIIVIISEMSIHFTILVIIIYAIMVKLFYE